jgi:hypothetical protein
LSYGKYALNTHLRPRTIRNFCWRGWLVSQFLIGRVHHFASHILSSVLIS